MKKVEEIDLPELLRYSEDHEWVKAEGGLALIGITDYAQDQLGDVVYVELPAAGARFAQGEVFATVESVKAVSECFLPLAGEIVAVNGRLAEDPALLNRDPYGDGWLIRLRPDDPASMETLLTAGQYRSLLRGEA